MRGTLESHIRLYVHLTGADLGVFKGSDSLVLQWAGNCYITLKNTSFGYQPSLCPNTKVV